MDLRQWAIKSAGVRGSWVKQAVNNPDPGAVQSFNRDAAAERGRQQAAAFQAGNLGTGYQTPDPYGRTPSGPGIPLNLATPKTDAPLKKPLAPDLADKLVREARTAQLLRLQMGQGRKASFSGAFGAPGSGLNRALLGG